MIRLRDVSMRYPSRSGPRTIFDKISLTIRPGEKIGILGRNGTGKSTLIRLIAGAERPSSGTITRDMSVSWPLAFGGAFQGSLTGMDNLRFICRVYGVDPKSRVDFVREFSELGASFFEPMRTYSSGMRARFAFAMSMAIEFDCFLIDEVITVGDQRFHQRCRTELFEKRADRALIIVSHEAHNIREHCDRACVLAGGQLHQFDSVDAAYELYEQVESA